MSGGHLAPGSERHRTLILGAILISALGVRMLLASQVDVPSFLAVDGRDYVDISKNIADGNGFAVSFYRWFEPVPPGAPGIHPDLYRPPLLPLVGAALFPLPGDWMPWARAAMLMMGLVMVCLVYILAAMLFGTSVGLWAAAFIAFDPFAAHYATVWSTETPFALFLLLAVTLLAKTRLSPSARLTVLAGVALGLASLARPTGLLIAAGLLIWLGATRARSGRLPAIVPAALAMLLLISPWAARNAALTGTPNPATFFGPYNLWLGNNHTMHEMYRAGEGDSFPALLDALYAEESKDHVRRLEQDGRLDAASANRYWMAETAAYVSRHPGEAAETLFRRSIHFFRPWPNRATTRAIEFWASLLWVCPVMGFALLALLRSRGARDPLLLLPIILGFAASVPFIFHLRFRFPVFDCYVATLAAAAVPLIRRDLRLRSGRGLP